MEIDRLNKKLLFWIKRKGDSDQSVVNFVESNMKYFIDISISNDKEAYTLLNVLEKCSNALRLKNQHRLMVASVYQAYVVNESRIKNEITSSESKLIQNLIVSLEHLGKEQQAFNLIKGLNNDSKSSVEKQLNSLKARSITRKKNIYNLLCSLIILMYYILIDHFLHVLNQFNIDKSFYLTLGIGVILYFKDYKFKHLIKKQFNFDIPLNLLFTESTIILGLLGIYLIYPNYLLILIVVPIVLYFQNKLTRYIIRS